MFGICNLAIIPLRAEPSDRSEIVSQVLFGEHFEVVEELKQWRRIKLHYDAYEGWVDSKQFQIISEAAYNTLSKEPIVLNADLIDYISAPNNILLPISLGASLSFLQHSDINTTQFEFEGTKTSGIQDKNQLISTAFMYLNAPYLWGGKSPLGIDCSGFTQMVARTAGIKLMRDAYQQAEQGITLGFIEEASAGDLVFFDNEEERIIHVGVLLSSNEVIHASGKVRIDKIDHQGIFNQETGKYTHNLRLIKRII
jgi:hypothetical protein